MIKYLINKTITKIEELDDWTLLRIHIKEGGYLDFIHKQECCEAVWLEDGIEELERMIGQKVLNAYSDYHDDLTQEELGSNMSASWTFYNIATKNTDACLRFVGTSNGNYSETVELKISK
ncbi:MAG: DUF7448 domain-containing protein [Fusobacteriaceae bacterium]